MNRIQALLICLSAALIATVAGCGPKETAIEAPAPDETGEAPASMPLPEPAPAEGEEPETALPQEPAPEQPEAAEPESPMADESGWISLFNGQDLTGWQNAADPTAENRWLVEDGCLTNMDHANNTRTVDEWKDFDLQLQYKTVVGGNSGVFLRGRVEIQILDSYGKEAVDTGDNGGIYGQFAPLVNASKPAGEWNLLEATYVGDMLTAKLNGLLIHDNRQITAVTGAALPGGVNDPGPLMLQGDHGKVWFRNIKVRPVAPAPAEQTAPEEPEAAAP